LQPIFKEYIQFLKDNGVDLPIEEGYYWLDNQIIKAKVINNNHLKLKHGKKRVIDLNIN